MDDLEKDEAWYHDMFVMLRNENAKPRTVQEWFDDFDVAVKKSRLRHPMADRLALGLISGLAIARHSLKRKTYRHGEEDE